MKPKMPEQKQKGPLTLQSQTGHIERKTTTKSISQDAENIPIALDSFAGTVRDFQKHLYLNRLLIENGIAT